MALPLHFLRFTDTRCSSPGCWWSSWVFRCRPRRADRGRRAVGARRDALAPGLCGGFAAALLSDCCWFFVGRRYGQSVLRLLCKLSLEPTTCVRRTQDSFGRMRGNMLLWAKFVPGLALLAPPVAGQNGMAVTQFLFFDGIGAALWVGSCFLVGRLFGAALESDPRLLAWAARFSGVLFMAALIAVLAARILRRRAVLRELAAARLEPDELKRLLDSGEQVYIVDLRHPLELLPEPYTLPGALHFAPDTLTARHNEIPRDRDVVLFCTCPSEATAAKTAMTLHKLGIERVRPLRGGYDEWKRLGFPLDEVASFTRTESNSAANA